MISCAYEEGLGSTCCSLKLTSTELRLTGTAVSCTSGLVVARAASIVGDSGGYNFFTFFFLAVLVSSQLKLAHLPGSVHI